MPSLELERLSQRFGDTHALDEVSLTVGPGEILGITGPSGAGKSTLCRIVSGVQTPARGDVCIDGVPVTGVPPDRRGAIMSFVRALPPPQRVERGVPLRRPAPRARPTFDASRSDVLRLV